GPGSAPYRPPHSLLPRSPGRSPSARALHPHFEPTRPRRPLRPPAGPLPRAPRPAAACVPTPSTSKTSSSGGASCLRKRDLAAPDRLRPPSFALPEMVSSPIDRGKGSSAADCFQDGAWMAVNTRSEGKRDAQLQERPPLLVPAGSELAVAAEGVLQGDGLLAPLGKIPPVRDVELRRDVLAQAEEEGVAVALGDFHHVHSQGFLQRPAQGPVDFGDHLAVDDGRQDPGQ